MTMQQYLDQRDAEEILDRDPAMILANAANHLLMEPAYDEQGPAWDEAYDLLCRLERELRPPEMNSPFYEGEDFPDDDEALYPSWDYLPGY